MQYKLALVTGTSRGIGKFIANKLLKSGVELITVNRSNVFCGFGSHRNYLVDLSKSEEVISFLDKLPKQIDLLINNAGVYFDNPAFDSSAVNSPLLFQKTLNVNLVSPFFITKYILENMLTNGQGLIVNMSSGLGRLETPVYDYGYYYRSSKLALNGLTIDFANKIEREPPNKVKIISYCPGLVNTNMGRDGMPASTAAENFISTIADHGNLRNGKFYRDGKELSYVSK